MKKKFDLKTKKKTIFKNKNKTIEFDSSSFLLRIESPVDRSVVRLQRQAFRLKFCKKCLRHSSRILLKLHKTKFSNYRRISERKNSTIDWKTMSLVFTWPSAFSTTRLASKSHLFPTKILFTFLSRCRSISSNQFFTFSNDFWGKKKWKTRHFFIEPDRLCRKQRQRLWCYDNKDRDFDENVHRNCCSTGKKKLWKTDSFGHFRSIYNR